MINHHFGGCPQCGRNNGYFNIGRDHWAMCENHKTKWHIGVNLFPTWQKEGQEIWDKNTESFSEYEEVKPIFSPLKLVVRSNCMLTRENCPVCRASHKEAGIPYWIFLDGGYSGICLECAEKLDPTLFEVVEAANENHWRKEKASYPPDE